MSTRILERLIFSSSKYCGHRKCNSFKNCVALLPWFRDCHFDGSVSSNVPYVTWSHRTDCHAESPAGRVKCFIAWSLAQAKCFKMAKTDPVSPFYPSLWKVTLQWENLQEVRKTSLQAVNIYFCAFRNWKCLQLCFNTQLPPAYHENSWTSIVSYKDFLSITLANSQLCFKWMPKCVISIALRELGVIPHVKFVRRKWVTNL